MSVSAINSLLDDKLFQVVGSTPRSIAESLNKADLKNKTEEGVQMFAACVFAAAVNKPTLETFLAEPRFANVRRIISAVMSIQNRSNMTALTLLGHCFLTTELADKVTFTSEFRKKMGQKDLWAGELKSGSLSEKQREILSEKKRVTNEEEAKALGSGFLKHTGIISGSLNTKEAEFFGVPTSSAARAMSPPAVPIARSAFTPPHLRGLSSSSVPVAADASSSRFASISIDLPEDVLNYRRDIMNQTDAEIADGIARRGKDEYINRTRRAMNSDPTGDRARSGSVLGSSS